jgi:hypothetical protein
MPIAYKVLGQSQPAATTLTTLYTVPASTSAVVSTINICNLQNNANTTVRIAVRPGGATITNQHYIVYELPVPAADSVALTMGVTLAATDVVSVYSTSGSVSFALFGSEIT